MHDVRNYVYWNFPYDCQLIQQLFAFLLLLHQYKIFKIKKNQLYKYSKLNVNIKILINIIYLL